MSEARSSNVQPDESSSSTPDWRHLQPAVTAAEARRLANQPQHPSTHSSQERHFLASIEARETSPDPQDPLALDPIFELIFLYIELERFVDAERIALLALSRARSALGSRDPDTTLRCIRTLAVIYEKQGRLDEAEKGCRMVLKEYERLTEPSQWSVLAAMQTLISVLKVREQWVQAKEVCEEALDKAERLFGPECEMSICLAIDLTTICKQVQDPSVEERYLQAIERAENGLGRHNIRTLCLRNNLGNHYVIQQRPDEAEEMFEVALEGYRAVLGDHHSFTGDVLYARGSIRYKQDRLDEAAGFYGEALRAYEAALGEADRKTVDTRRMLAYTFHEQQKWAKAHANYTQAIRGWTEEFEAGDPQLKDLEDRLVAVNAHLSSL